jgi:hypothetical protein
VGSEQRRQKRRAADRRRRTQIKTEEKTFDRINRMNKKIDFDPV